MTLIVGIIGLLLSFIVYKTSNSDEPPKYLWAVTIMAFINSIIWIGLIADELISFLTFL